MERPSAAVPQTYRFSAQVGSAAAFGERCCRDSSSLSRCDVADKHGRTEANRETAPDLRKNQTRTSWCGISEAVPTGVDPVTFRFSVSPGVFSHYVYGQNPQNLAVFIRECQFVSVGFRGFNGPNMAQRRARPRPSAGRLPSGAAPAVVRVGGRLRTDHEHTVLRIRGRSRQTGLAEGTGRYVVLRRGGRRSGSRRRRLHWCGRRSGGWRRGLRDRCLRRRVQCGRVRRRWGRGARRSGRWCRCRRRCCGRRCRWRGRGADGGARRCRTACGVVGVSRRTGVRHGGRRNPERGESDDQRSREPDCSELPPRVLEPGSTARGQ